MPISFGDIERTRYIYRDRNKNNLQLLDGNSLQQRKSKSEKEDIDDAQFRLLVLDESTGTFVDPHHSEAKISGSSDAPDVRARVEMLAFHAGNIELNEDHANATLRLDIGQGSLNSVSLTPLFWSVAAGLDLASMAHEPKDSLPRRYRDDFSVSFGNRPIELPGGNAQIRFQVLSHPKQAWWQEIFGFAKSRTGDRLISSLGFPGITREAIKIIDQALGMLNSPEVIFQSDKMDFALSAYARHEYTMGMPNIEVGVINPGFCLLVPHSKYAMISGHKPKYLATHGRLVPGEWDYDDFHSEQQNPLEDVPYAVLRVRSESCSLYGGL